MKKILLILFMSISTCTSILSAENTEVAKDTAPIYKNQYPMIKLSLANEESLFLISLFYRGDPSYKELTNQLSENANLLDNKLYIISLSNPFVLHHLTKHAIETGKIEILKSLLKLFINKNPDLMLTGLPVRVGIKNSNSVTENDSSPTQYFYGSTVTKEQIISLVELIEMGYPESENKKMVLSLFNELGINNPQIYKGEPVDQNFKLLNVAIDSYPTFPCLLWKKEATNSGMLELTLVYESTDNYLNLTEKFQTETIEDAYGPGFASVNFSNTLMFFIDHAIKTMLYDMLETLLKLRTVPYESWTLIYHPKEISEKIQKKLTDPNYSEEIKFQVTPEMISEIFPAEKVKEEYPDSAQRRKVLQLLEQYEIKNNA